MRINARLDEEASRSLTILKESTGLTTTQIIKQSLQAYLEQTQAKYRKNNQLLLETLAGIGEGPEDLSENYKEYLKEGLSEKHGID
jgi:predicted DNA-binding protein